MIDIAPPVPASLRIARDQGTRPRNGWRPSSRSTAACANDRIHEGHIPDSYLRSDAKRSGNFTKRCFFRVADLNSSSKQTSAFGSRLGGLLADLTKPRAGWAPWETVPRTASGRPEAVADDERDEEVRLIDSTCEASEQSGAIHCGVGGGRRWDQEECGTAKHGPDAESGSVRLNPGKAEEM